MIPIISQLLKNMGTKIFFNRSAVLYLTRCMTHSLPGSGAGKGGGAGGSVKETGGGMGRFRASQEERFFYNKSREEMQRLKQKMKEQAEQKQKKED